MVTIFHDINITDFTYLFFCQQLNTLTSTNVATLLHFKYQSGFSGFREKNSRLACHNM
jgi:hypothetical protein